MDPYSGFSRTGLKLKLSLATVLVLSGLCACGRTDDSAELDAVIYTAETAVTAISGAADDQDGSSFADASKKTPALDHLSELLLPRAWAASCTRVSAAACSSSVRSATYSGCDLGTSAYTLTGSASLTYSQALCTMGSNGDTITRTMDFTRTGPFRATLQTTSTSHAAYDGTTVGGGQVLTRNSPTDYSLQIRGIHKTLTTAKGRTLFDHSIKTSSDLHLNGLVRSGRSMTSGTINVYHNVAGYIASYSVGTALVWTASCCYPTSGSLNVSFSGSVTSTGTITFSSTCGSAELTRGSDTSQISMSYCE